MNLNYIGVDLDNDTLNRINLLLATPVGTMPNDREYGVDFSFLDMPLNVAEDLFLIEASSALDKYEKNITVDSVEFVQDLNGMITATLFLTENPEYDEDLEDSTDSSEDYEEEYYYE